MMIVPYHVDVPMQTRPWMNWVLIGVTIAFYPFCITDNDLTPLGETLALGGSSPLGWVGHVFVHAGLVHLFGNMLFLWVFGNAVCAKVGNFVYPFIYFGLAVMAGLGYMMVTPGLAVGASGAINGIVGMFAVWYFLNEISCWYFFWYVSAANAGFFSLSSYWMILIWFVFDVWGLMRGGDSVGYAAHLAGFISGFVLAIVLLLTKWIEMDRGERSLLQVFSDD